MTAAKGNPIGRPTARQGFSLVETAVSTVLVGLVLVVALRTVGSATSAQGSNAERGRACHLAGALLAEILDLAYEDPELPGSLGPESGEEATGTRADFDDVDDYHGWNAGPPENQDGTTLADLAGWERDVTVEYVDPDDLTAAAGSDLGVKRVTVTVTRDGRQLGSLTTVITRSWQQPPYD